MKEEKLLCRLHRYDRRALRLVCAEHGENMLLLAFTILNDPEEANILVRDLLLTLWEQGFPGAHPPLHTYLYDQVRQGCQLVAVKISD